VAWVEAYLHAKFHLDQPSRLASIHQGHRQTFRIEQTDRQRSDSIGGTVSQTVAEKRFALCYRTVACLSPCLSVTLVYCGQTVGWINICHLIGTEVASALATLCQMETQLPTPKGAQPPPIFSPCLLWTNVLDGSRFHLVWEWYGDRPRPRPHCVIGGLSSPPQKRHIPNFRPMSIVAKRLDGL